MKINLLRNINALWVMIFSLMITTAFGMQIFLGEEPCALCYLQRHAMLLVSSAAMMNIVYGLRAINYGLAILASLYGASVAIRQILLHICPGSPPYDVFFLGVTLYTWSFLSFVGSLLLIAFLLANHEEEGKRRGKLNAFHITAIAWCIAIVAANIASTLFDCGAGGC